jgi:hypothetical protein
MIKLMERTIHSLQHKLDGETEKSLALTMHFPTAWDPHFQETMSVLAVYHYYTQHFDHHHKQLTISDRSAPI